MTLARSAHTSHTFVAQGPPTKTLTRHIKRRDWDGARIRTLTNPQDARWRGNKGTSSVTPMHLVCLYRAPLDLVELIIDANPDALLEQDEEGMTPLHLTILYGSDEQTVLLLIRRGGKMAASLQSPQVGSPLHLACRHGTPISVLEALVQANIDMATAPTESGTKPAEVVWSQFLRQCKNFRVFDVVVDSYDNGNEIKANHTALRDLVDRIKILFSAACSGSRRCNGGREHQEQYTEELKLHDLISNLSILGDISPFLDIAVRLYPEQVSTMDQQGNFPLHLVACNPPTGLAGESSSLERYLQTTSFIPRDPIEVLATSFPIAASVSGQYGDLPLHLALKNGRRKWGEGLSSLVQAFPFALERRDAETRFFPFQLASIYPVGSDLESLTTIFNLLLACPHVAGLEGF